MDFNNWRSNPPGGEPAMDTGDWRNQLQPDLRHRIVNKFMETLNRHLPFSGWEGLNELEKIAVRFEEKIYTAATSQSHYLRKISVKMLTMESKSQTNPLPSNSAGNSNKPPDPVSGKALGVNAPVHNAKTQKLSEEWNIDVSRNRIGNLPDMILGHILSFLPIKYAGRTSILSKRWQYLWMSVPDLDFRQGAPKERTLFMNVVERILLLRDSLSIRKFTLECDVLHDASRVNAWVFAAVRHKVEELDLRLSDFQEPFVLPSCLFNCDSLTKLRLSMDCDLKLPSSICFSNLKILDLWYVVFPDDFSTQQLFSGCPVLEELCLHACGWANITAVSISAPMLRKLSIVDDTNDEDDDTDDEISSNGCQVKIFGINLKSLSYEGYLRNDYCLCNLPSLVDARIKVDVTSREIAYRALQLLRQLCNVKSLTLSFDTIEVLSETEEFLARLPMFNNLTSLKLDDSRVTFYDGALLNILRNSPCLSSLEFTRGLQSGIQAEWMFDPMPPCLITHLKTLKVSDFCGGEDEKQVLKVLLEYGMVLGKVIVQCNPISFYRIGGLQKLKEIHEQVLSLPRRSVRCEIVFS